MKAAGEKKKLVDMPTYLKRHLTLQEFLHKQSLAEEEDNRCVVWKFGRTSHFTFGIFSHIKSDYLSTSGIISDELAVVDHNKMSLKGWFSDNGDSGSLVWGSDGFVSGLLWGGKEQESVTYVTPMAYVLDDIRQVCNAKDVGLVIRKEDGTDTVFGPPERKSGTFSAGAEQESGTVSGPALFGDDDMAEILGAESDKGSSRTDI